MITKAGSTRGRKAALLGALLIITTSTSFLILGQSLSGGDAFTPSVVPEGYQIVTEATKKATHATPPWLVVPINYSTIQEAINEATPGWGIVVLSTYDPGDAGEVFPIEVNKSLTIIGKGDEPIKVDAEDASSAFSVTADDVTIEGFKVEGASDYQISLNHVQDCKIRDNTVEGKGVAGIILFHSYDNVVSGNVVEKNNYSIYLHYSDGNVVKSNVVEKSLHHGIRLLYSDGNTILYNTVTRSEHSGIVLRDSHGNEVKGNVANRNGIVWRGHGIYLHHSHGNAIKDNTAKENEGYGIYVWWSDGNAVEDNTATSGACGILLDNSKNNVVKGNTATHNNGPGIYLRNQTYTLVKGNTATHNNHLLSYAAGNIVLHMSNWTDVKDNQASFSVTANGIFLLGNSDHNVVDANVAVSNANAGIRLMGAEPRFPNSNTISNNIALDNPAGDYIPGKSDPLNHWYDNYGDP